MSNAKKQRLQHEAGCECTRAAPEAAAQAAGDGVIKGQTAASCSSPTLLMHNDAWPELPSLHLLLLLCCKTDLESHLAVLVEGQQQGQQGGGDTIMIRLH